MARTRLVNPNAPMDEDVATMSLAARYAWAYLPCHADREGRLRDSSFFLRAQIFPGETIDMEAVLAELAERRHIIRYKAEGRSYIQIRSFARHQAPHARETASEIPPPPTEGEPKASLGQALGEQRPTKVGEELHRVASSPSCSDPDPVSDPVLLPSDPVPILSNPDQTRTHSEIRANEAGLVPFRAPRSPLPWDATMPFVRCFERYPNGNGKIAAAGVWQDIAATFPGGEIALEKAISARFDAGMLARHPYAGEAKFRPTFEKFLFQRRWEDPDSAPDDVAIPEKVQQSRDAWRQVLSERKADQ